MEKVDVTEIYSALVTVKRLSSLSYGRYALGGNTDVSDDLATLYRMAVAGMDLCEVMQTRTEDRVPVLR